MLWVLGVLDTPKGPGIEGVVPCATRGCDNPSEQVIGDRKRNSRKSERISSPELRYNVLGPAWYPGFRQNLWRHGLTPLEWDNYIGNLVFGQ
jgi:hypothetical protein